MEVRHLREEEVPILNEFLYHAIYVPKGMLPPSRTIIHQPELQVYVKDFGKCYGDCCLVAEVGGEIVGAVWTRLMKDYGYVAENIPSLAISMLPDYRGKGMGTSLMISMFEFLCAEGFSQVSLSVQKENYAVRMYFSLGFEIVRETDDEYVMKKQFVIRDKDGNKDCIS